MDLKSGWLLLILTLMGIALVLVAGQSVQADTVLPGGHTVTGTETWTAAGSPYIVQGNLIVASGGHLMLEPGVEVRIMAERLFAVEAGGRLSAEGTAQDPVTITAIPGNFVGLRLHSGAQASLAYCDVSQAGASGYPPVDIQSSAVRLDHCTIHHSGVGSGSAVQLIGTGLSPTLTHTTIQSNTGYAIYQSTVDMIPTYADLTLAGNGTDAVAWNNSYLNRALTLDGPQLNGSPFISLDSLNVNSSGHLTLSAGTELQIQAARGLYVQSGGVLAAEGTATNPITITARDPGAPFVAIFFVPGSAGSLTYCDVHHAGASAYPAVDIQSSEVTLDHCTIHDNGVGSGYVVKLTGAGLSPTLRYTTIENNSGSAIYQSTIDMTPLYQNLTIRDNGTDAVVWNSGTLNRSLTLDGQQIGGNPYLSLDSINVNDGGHLILNPGTELRMQASRGLWVKSGGALTAEGTAPDPVVLTAIDPGAPWVKLGFLPGSAGSLDHCDVSRAGASSSPVVDIQSSDVVLDHCTIHGNTAGSGAALLLTGAGLSPTISNTTILDNSGRALQQSTIDMTPVYANLTFSGNGTDALVIANGDLYRALTLDGRQLNGGPIISLDQINIWNLARLTLAPGTEIRLSTSDAIYVESGGTLIAEGTAADPVTLTSVEPTAPFLKLHFLPGSTSSLAYCDLSHAGGSGYDALAVYSPDFTMSHCVVHDNGGWGMRLFQGAGSPLLDNMVFADNGGGGLYVERDVDVALRHATFARNGGDGIRVRDGATAALTNTIVAGHETGLRVVTGGWATMAHTLWDGNTQDVAGEVTETGRFEGSAAFAADGYHLTASSAALSLGTGTGVTDDIDGEPRPLPAGTLPDLGADETGATLQSWQKSIDGQPWQPAFTLTVETLDTFEVVDLVSAGSSVLFTLTESWDAAHLTLSSYTLEPPGAGTVTTTTGTLTWEVAPGHAGAATLTKLFIVQPCTWTATTLQESLEGLDIPDPSRPVSFHKTPPDLWIEASNGYQVHPGEIATATLTYGNNGGKEPGISVQADLAAGASLYDADPVPWWQAADGSEVHWQIETLGMGDGSRIGLSIAIAPDVLPPASLVITGQIRDHTGQAAGAVNITYQVSESPRHDVAVASASPRGELPVGEPVDVTAELFNDGSETEEGVPVRCAIEGPASGLVYSETASSGAVAAGTFAQIEFPAWTPAEAGSHTLTCRSLLPGDEDPANDVYTQVLTATQAGAPDVWTRDNEADTGDVPSGHPWWVSPDIWVRNLPDGGLVHQNPVVYQENTIYVRLRNRGTQAASGVVGVYWSRSRVGWPCKIWSPNVGTIPFEDLAPGEVRIVQLAWVPGEPGRHGLHTVIDAGGDPADWGAPCSPHRPSWDNNVSWRNTVAHFRPHKPARQLLAAEDVGVDLANPYDWSKEVDLIVERATFPPTGTISVRLAEPLFDRWQAYEGHWSQGIDVLTETKLLTVSGEVTATIGGIPMDAHEEATATLLFDAPGEGMFEVALQERIDGLSVGGVSYEWLVSDVEPPAVVAHSPGSGAIEVPLDAPVVVTFSEEIGPLTFELVFTPALNEWRKSSNGDGTVFTVTHPAFAPATRYTATLKARDAFANPLAAPYTWSFAAREGWNIYLPLVVRDG